MATGGVQEVFTAEHVLTAMLTMRGSAADKKKVAMDYLAKFQKSVSTFISLPHSDTPPSATPLQSLYRGEEKLTQIPH